MTNTALKHLSTQALRREIAAMEHELRRRAEPKWTGRTHEWSAAEHPLAKACVRCGVPLVPLVAPHNTNPDWRDGDVLAPLWIREDCPR